MAIVRYIYRIFSLINCYNPPKTELSIINGQLIYKRSLIILYLNSPRGVRSHPTNTPLRTGLLGMLIHVRNDDLDIVRQLKSVILRKNILMRTFSSCSVEVKLFVFKSYCSNFYYSHLWYNFTKVQMNKLRITYNNATRRLFNLHFRCSASEMFANSNIHSMDEKDMYI